MKLIVRNNALPAAIRGPAGLTPGETIEIEPQETKLVRVTEDIEARAIE
jgi:hypothetical protein